MILKIVSKYKHRFLYIVLGITLFILLLESLVYIILILPYGYYLMKNQRDIIIAIIIIISLIKVHQVYVDTKSIDDTGQWQMKVIKVNDKEANDDYYTIVNYKKVRLYLSQETALVPGDIIIITGSLKQIEPATLPRGFDYQRFLKSKRVYGVIEAETVTYVKRSFHINMLPYKIEEYIEHNIKQSPSYIKTFILADKSDFDPAFITNVNQLGISHLFAVSGLHVGMLALFIHLLLTKLRISKNKIEIVIMIVLSIYLVLTGFTASITRAALMYIFIVYNKKYKLSFSTLDIISFIYILLLIYHPYYYLDIGFVLSFLMTFILVLSQNIIPKNSLFKTLLTVSFIAFMASMPIVANMNNQINLLTILANVVFVPFITFIILPLSYITFVFPFFDGFLFVIITLFEKIISLFQTIDIFIIRVFFNHPLWVIVYYTFFYQLMINFRDSKRRNRILLNMTLLIIIMTHLTLLNPVSSINFLDIKGESTVLMDRFNKCNIVIDTGEIDSYDSLIAYLDQHHIKRVDYLIVSHFHSDHSGEFVDLSNHYQVRNWITNKNVTGYDGKMIRCGNVSLYIYPMPYESTNENENSIILSIWFEGNHYLFTGDTETGRESVFIELYDVDVDILKVGHHGSITSSSIDFINHINPEKAIINIDRDNSHGHPSNIVIERLSSQNIDVERTDVYGTIQYFYFLGKEYKKYYIP